jgi:hypothetical protein
MVCLERNQNVSGMTSRIYWVTAKPKNYGSENGATPLRLRDALWPIVA